jgi:transcriptional regulator with XRE-family HTH domain
MRLTEYLRRQKMSQAAFARKLGVAQPAVNRYCRGERVPVPELLVRIERITAGMVRVEDFVKATRQRAREAQREEGAEA